MLPPKNDFKKEMVTPKEMAYFITRGFFLHFEKMAYFILYGFINAIRTLCAMVKSWIASWPKPPRGEAGCRT